MKLISLFFICFILLLAGCSKDEPVSPNSSESNAAASLAKQVPFRVHFETTFEIISTTPPGVLTFEIFGTGNGTHLGKAEFYSISVVDLNYVPGQQTGSLRFTGANGDYLDGSFAGTIVEEDGNVSFEGEYTFSGGTGRFSGASGSGAYAGTANLPAEMGQVTFSGTVSSPGSH